MTPGLVPTHCLVCGRKRHWWATGWWRHDLGRVQPFPRGMSMWPCSVLLAAPLCSRECSQEFVAVLGGSCELSAFEKARRAAKERVTA
jgi:hypothetical protein